MRLGIFAKTFVRPSLGSSLDAVVAAGFDLIQFNLALVGGPSLPDDIPDPAAIRAEVESRGLTMAAVSGSYNMAHPDPAVRVDGRSRLSMLVEAAPLLGTSVVTVCTGTRDPDDMWRAHPDNASAEAWADMLASLSAVLPIAERRGVTLGIEPEHANVVVDARAARRLLDELASPNLRIVLDPANIGGDSLDEAFELLGDDLVLAHAKGDVDWARYLELLAPSGVPLIMHGLSESDVPARRAELVALSARRGRGA